MKKTNRILSTAIFCFCVSISFGQSSLENTYSLLNENHQKFNYTLDSLNQLLDKQVQVINTEKLKNDNDSDKLSELLSATASVTNLIDATHLNIEQNSEKISKIKNKLFKLYSNQIDSLKSNINNKNNSVDIIRLTEKRLLVSQKIDMLSFSPQSVINIKTTNNEIEQKIYNEYLLEAEKEVETKLSEINNLRNEIEIIIELNKETEEFLEDVNFDNNFAVYSNPATVEGSTSLENSADYISEAKSNTLTSQTKSFGDILFQFGLSTSLTSDIQVESDKNGSTSLREFGGLINKVEKQLNDYKTVISNKLRNTNSK